MLSGYYNDFYNLIKIGTFPTYSGQSASDLLTGDDFLVAPCFLVRATFRVIFIQK